MHTLVKNMSLCSFKRFVATTSFVLEVQRSTETCVLDYLAYADVSKIFLHAYFGTKVK